MRTIGKMVMMMMTLFLAFKGTEKAANSEMLPQGWMLLEPGLEFGVFLSPQPSEVGDSLIRVLRIDPKRFEFRLLNASATADQHLLTAKQWSQAHRLVAAINASMYQQDYLSSVSLMRTKQHVNNPRLSKDKTILAFDRTATDVPLLKMIDRQCEDFEDWQAKYQTFVQSIRMISCKGRNVWSQQPQKWSMAVIGIDQQGRGLFIHVRSPYSTYDLINILLELPLQIARAMYAEGGREAQLYVRSGDQEYELIGNSRTGIDDAANNQLAHPIPNVVGIVRRTIAVQ